MKRLGKIALLLATLSFIGGASVVQATSHDTVARGLCHCSY